MKIKVIFVCLGNICRSPMAEGMFQHLVKQNNLAEQFIIDSAGTAAYHIGKGADQRMKELAFSHGISLTSKARQFKKEDLEEFDYILVMDNSNLKNVLNLADSSNSTDHVELLRKYDSNQTEIEVPDPYYGGLEGFEEVYQITLRSCTALLNTIIKENNIV